MGCQHRDGGLELASDKSPVSLSDPSWGEQPARLRPLASGRALLPLRNSQKGEWGISELRTPTLPIAMHGVWPDWAEAGRSRGSRVQRYNGYHRALAKNPRRDKRGKRKKAKGPKKKNVAKEGWYEE